jgi:hypothetical protein
MGRARRCARVCTLARPERLTLTDRCKACKTADTSPLQRLPQGTLRENTQELSVKRSNPAEKHRRYRRYRRWRGRFTDHTDDTDDKFEREELKMCNENELAESHSHDPRHLQPLPILYGGSGRKRDGRCARLTHPDTASKQETHTCPTPRAIVVGKSSFRQQTFVLPTVPGSEASGQ